jgi:hypothetical protein
MLPPARVLGYSRVVKARAIKMIPLNRLETDLKRTLDECAESGQTVVVQLPNQRLLAISLLHTNEDDTLVDELRAGNPHFQALVAKSKAGSRKPLVIGRAIASQ